MGLTGCAAQLPSAPAVDFAKAARVMTFPMIDARAKSTVAQVKMDLCLKAVAQRHYDQLLAYKNAVSTLPPAALLPEELPRREDLESDVAEWFRKTVPSGDADYALFMFVPTFEVSGPSFEYRIDAYLVDPVSGTVSWKTTYKDSKWVGIIDGMFARVIDVVPPVTACRALGTLIGKAIAAMPKLERRVGSRDGAAPR